jgi:excisionase family DNA binding protein
MATGKTGVKASTHKAMQPGVMAREFDAPASGGTLESTVLAMLNSARAATRRETTPAAAGSRPKSPSVESKPPRTIAGPGRTTPPEGIDPAKLATLQSYSRKLNEGLHKQGWMQVKTVRFRPRGENIDRKFVVESSLDPVDNSAVIMRVRPATDAELPEPGPKYLTTEQAAKVLNVSRPYVISLADTGMLKGVMRTGANHRRIPEPEVLRMRELMHTQMRKGTKEIQEHNGDLRQRELDEARKTVTRRWVAKAPRTKTRSNLSTD